MGKQSIIPFGPQHPVLPEPIHLDLVIEDEKIVEAIPSIGFVHRGLESLVDRKDFNEMAYVIERTCGICSFMHGMGYCESVEHIMNVEVPARGRYLRTIWAEMSRVHSHLLWLGLLADGFGFESLFYQCWRMREKVLDVFELTTGGRCIFSVNKVGGVLKDINEDMLKVILDVVGGIETELKEIKKTFLFDYTVESRLKGVGVLTKEQAAAVKPEKMTAFFRSSVGKRVLSADKVWRELKFSLLVDAEDYFENAGEEKILLQGVVDCCILEAGGLTVIDFKTDRVTEETAKLRAEAYRGQLSAYAGAMERMLGYPVREKLLYFFSVSDVLSI